MRWATQLLKPWIVCGYCNSGSTAPTIDTTTTNLINIAAPDKNSDNYYDANNTITVGVTFDKNV